MLTTKWTYNAPFCDLTTPMDAKFHEEFDFDIKSSPKPFKTILFYDFVKSSEHLFVFVGDFPSLLSPFGGLYVLVLNMSR